MPTDHLLKVPMTSFKQIISQIIGQISLLSRPLKYVASQLVHLELHMSVSLVFIGLSF